MVSGFFLTGRFLWLFGVGPVVVAALRFVLFRLTYVAAAQAADAGSAILTYPRWTRRSTGHEDTYIPPASIRPLLTPSPDPWPRTRGEGPCLEPKAGGRPAASAIMAESALRLTPSMSQADLDPLWAREDIHTYPSGLSRAAARAIHTYPSRDVPRRLMYVEKVQNAATSAWSLDS